jgi:hypothetical protein
VAGEPRRILHAQDVGQFVEPAGVGIPDVRALFQQLGDRERGGQAQFLVVDEQDPLDQPGDAPGVAAAQAVRGVPLGQEGRQVGGLSLGRQATSTGPCAKAPQTEAYTSSDAAFLSSARPGPLLPEGPRQVEACDGCGGT